MGLERKKRSPYTKSSKAISTTKTSPYLIVDFSGIPIDTNTLAGQWMTFSHMANHYRKLLNVKPRVDTGIPHNQGSYHKISSLNSSRMQSSKGGKTMGGTNTKSSSATNAKTSRPLCYQTIRRDNIMYGSHPEHLNISGKPSPSFLQAKESIGRAKEVIEKSKSIIEKKPNHHHYPEYQVVFGPSSIRSSSDAFLTDETDSTMSGDNNPPSEVQAPLGVSEKIRHFLNNIHQLDLKQSKKKKIKRVTTDSKEASKPLLSATPNSIPPSVISSSNQIDFRLSRHSRCFLPYEPSNSNTHSNINYPQVKSPKKCQKGGTTAVVSPTKSKKNLSSETSSPMISLNRKQGKSKITGDVEDIRSKSPRLSRNKFTGSGMDINMPEKDFNGNAKKQGRRRRAGSVASIGTICGSEELTPEDFPLSMKDIYATLGSGLLGDELLSTILNDNLQLMSKAKSNKSSQNHNHLSSSNNNSSGVSSVSTNLLKSNSMASLSMIPDDASKCKPGVSGSGVTNSNNKDSSRDSAYGFSSGESRITTRESTPEKKCLNDLEERVHPRGSHHHLRHHSDLQERPCKDKEQGSSRHKIKQKRSADDIDLKRRDSSEKYISFLTELTHDIVTKGIYTNKGLKTLFKAQLDQNKELNQEKLADMLERLRTDLGIPKDDALDRIEFGYGSISNATSTTFFYTPPSPQDKLSTDSVILRATTAAGSTPTTNSVTTSKVDGVLAEEPLNHGIMSSASPSPTTIIPCVPIPHIPLTNTSSNRSTTTTDDGSVPGSSIAHEHDDEEEDQDINGDYYEDELSLSENEVTQALKIAGLNDTITEEVVGMLKS